VAWTYADEVNVALLKFLGKKSVEADRDREEAVA
jgi:hypothetical protein